MFTDLNRGGGDESMNGRAHIVVPKDELKEFCRRNHICKLSLFGSVLRDDFRSDSDVDVLVELDREHGPGFIALFQIEQELSRLLGGRKVDLITKKFLNRRIRDQVLADAEIQYAER